MWYPACVEFFAQLKKITLLLFFFKHISDIFPPKTCLFLLSARYFSLYIWRQFLSIPFCKPSWQKPPHLDKISLRGSHCSRLNELKSLN